MIRIRRASAVAIGAAAVLAIGGTAALAAGADDPSPSPTSDDGGAVPMLPNGDPLPSPSSSSDDATPSPSPSASTGTVPPANSASSVSVAAAKAIAIRAAGGGRVTKVESEVEHGRAVWDVDVLVKGVEHDIDVDQETGTVTRHRVEAGDDNHRNGGGHEAGDDHGGRGSEAGDDHGGDDHGSGGHGSDD